MAAQSSTVDAVSSAVVLRPSGFAYDADALAYIGRIEQADNQALEAMVKRAINAFVVSCKADGIWSAIKASCILAGARTLDGALQPLVGTAPTNVGFLSGDYDRRTGLVGDKYTKYLNSNRSNNADPQNSQHCAVYVTAAGDAVSGNLFGSDGASVAGGTNLWQEFSATSIRGAIRGAGTGHQFSVSPANATGLKGLSRGQSASFVVRNNKTSTTENSTSATPTSGNIFIFARNDSTSPPQFVTNARLAYYSIGESLNLALLDARVTTLINAYQAAIQ